MGRTMLAADRRKWKKRTYTKARVYFETGENQEKMKQKISNSPTIFINLNANPKFH